MQEGGENTGIPKPNPRGFSREGLGTETSIDKSVIQLQLL